MLAAAERPTNPLPVIMLILLAAAILLAVASQHAIIRHGAIAEEIASRCNPSSGDSILLRMVRPSDQRTALACWFQDLGWVVSIWDPDGSNVSAFRKEKMRTLDQVIRYLTNAGYVK